MSTVFQTLVVSDQTVLPSQRDEVSTLWLQPTDPGLVSGITQDNSVRSPLNTEVTMISMPSATP